MAHPTNRRSRLLPRWTALGFGAMACVAAGIYGCSSSSSSSGGGDSNPDASLAKGIDGGSHDAGRDATAAITNDGSPATSDDADTSSDDAALIDAEITDAKIADAAIADAAIADAEAGSNEGVDVLTSSPNCTVVQGKSESLVDKNLDRWTLGTGADGGLTVERNGVASAGTSNTLELFYIGSTVYREDTIGEWYGWNGTAWASTTEKYGSCIGDSGAEPAPTHDAGSPSSRLTAKPSGSTTSPNGYYEYLPPNYDKNTPLPALIFIVGKGEEGNQTSDLHLITDDGYGPGYEMKNNTWSNDRPFIVLMPQYTLPSNGYCPSDDEVHAFITWAIANYNIDPKRLFLSGVSCGAIGSWDYIVKYKNAQIAAAVLLSGGASTGLAAGCSFDDVAIWSFHGSSDTTVPFPLDQSVMEMLLSCPEPRRDMQFTPITGGGHNTSVWEPVYSLSGGYGDIYQWLLEEAKP